MKSSTWSMNPIVAINMVCHRDKVCSVWVFPNRNFYSTELWNASLPNSKGYYKVQDETSIIGHNCRHLSWLLFHTNTQYTWMPLVRLSRDTQHTINRGFNLSLTVCILNCFQSINMHMYFLPFLNNKMVKAAQILPRGKQGLVYSK